MDKLLRREVEYFDKKSIGYRKEYDRETPEGYSFRVRRDKVLTLVPEGTNVLDIASGPGIMVRGLEARQCAITLIDAAPEMIACAKNEFPHIRALVGDAYALPFGDSEFDVATAMGLVEYLEHEDTFYKETRRVLKQDGRLIVTFPNYWSPWRVFNRLALALLNLFRAKKDVEITHREYTAQRAKKLLTENGFLPERIIYYNFKLIPYPLDHLFPRFTVFLSRIFEPLDRTPLAFFGTGFIVMARRK